MRQYAIGQRLVAGGADAAARLGRVRHVMGEEAASLLASEQSVVVVSGHFSREFLLSFTRPGIVPRAPIGVVKIGSRSDRVGVHDEMFRTLVQAALSNPGCIPMERGQRDVNALVDYLAVSGRAIHVHADYPLPATARRALRRPFAGAAERSFGTGAARTARLAQVPLLVCHAYPDGQGATVMQWSDPIVPPPRDDAASDERVTSLLLDDIERAVGMRPQDYMLPMGRDRQWDPVRRVWGASEAAEAAELGPAGS
jgi:hypothetical protein